MYHSFTLRLEKNGKKLNLLNLLYSSIDEQMNTRFHQFSLNESKSSAGFKFVFCYQEINQSTLKLLSKSFWTSTCTCSKRVSQCLVWKCHSLYAAHQSNWIAVKFAVKGSDDCGIDFWHSFDIFEWIVFDRMKKYLGKNEVFDEQFSNIFARK